MKTTEIIIFFSLLFCFSCRTIKKGNHYENLNQLEEKENQLVKEGIWMEYYNDSLDLCVLYYENGIKQGKVKIFCKNGEIILGYYKNNKREGLWHFFDIHDELYKKIWYLDDKEFWIYDVEDGKTKIKKMGCPY